MLKLGDKVVAWQMKAGLITSGVISDIIKHVGNTKQHISMVEEDIYYYSKFIRHITGINVTIVINWQLMPHGPYNLEDVFPDTTAMRNALTSITREYDNSITKPVVTDYEYNHKQAVAKE